MRPELTFDHSATPLMPHSVLECSAKGPVFTCDEEDTRTRRALTVEQSVTEMLVLKFLWDIPTTIQVKRIEQSITQFMGN